MINSVINALKSWVRNWESYGKGWLIIGSLAFAFAGSFVAVSFLVEHLFIRKFEDRGVAISFTDSGATQIKIGGELESAIFPVFASQGWVNSGIKIPPGATINIIASGQANLAVHRLVEAAEEDFKPDFPWTGPEGVDFQGVQPRDQRRKEGLIVKTEKIGALLAYLNEDGQSEPSLLDNPRPENIKVIKKGQTISNNSEKETTLWFIVNDVVLDSDINKSAQMYLPNKDNSEYHKKIEKWEYIKQQQYWDIWFDDNSGFYQVTIEIEED